MRLNIGKSPRPPASPNMIVFVFNRPGFLSSNISVIKTFLSLNISVVKTLLSQNASRESISLINLHSPIAHITSSSVKFSRHLYNSIHNI